MTRAPSTGDVEVGRRVRVFRLQRQMTQTTLGERLGLTFQQIQEYENGTNRIGAGRLQVIAEVLEVPVAAFFDTAASLRLLRAFERMENSAVRNAFVKLAESVAGDAEQSA